MAEKWQKSRQTFVKIANKNTTKSQHRHGI